MIKHTRNIKGAGIDIYDILKGYDVECHAIAEAIERLLTLKQNDPRNAETIKRKAIQAIERSIELSGGKLAQSD